MTTELLRSILILLVAFLLRLALVAIGVAIDEVTFNTIVAAIVAYVLAALGVEAARAKYPNQFK